MSTGSISPCVGVAERSPASSSTGPASRPAIRTSEDTVNLLRRLAQFHPDDVIAGILNRQGKVTAYGHPFNKIRVKSLRQHWNIPRFDPATKPANGELVTIKRAAELLEIAPSTVQSLAE